MRKMLVVAVREYVTAVRTRAFLITLVVMPLLMGGSALVQWMLRDYREVEPRSFAVVDRTPGARLYPAVEQAVAAYNAGTFDPATGRRVLPPFSVERVPASEDTPEAITEQRIALSERVRKGELFGFLDIGRDVLRPAEGGAEAPGPGIRYQSNRPTSEEFPQLVKPALLRAVEEARYQDARLAVPLDEVRKVLRPVPLTSTGLTRRNPQTGEVEDGTLQSRLAPVFVPIGLMMLMFTVIMMTATPLMQGVVEEKMQRIAEVLLGSVPPFQLMLGKLLGMTAVSLTITTVYLGGAFWAARHYGLTEYIPTALLAWFVVYQALAALMYGSLFIAVGAACTDMKETQNLMWPVMLLACMPLFLLGAVLREPNSAVATGASFFPFATPMLMILRLSVPPGVPPWQPVVGAAVVVAATLACVWAAGRVFRVGILLQGKGARLAEVLRWVFRG